MSTKKSIRFFNDQKVRAVWSDSDNKWYFSATDVVRAINNEEDYTKCRNYWKYLKGKFAKEGIQLVSDTNHFKFEAPDGKMRKADVLDNEAVQLLAKHYPNNRANAFLDWFTYAENSIGKLEIPETVLEELLQNALVHLDLLKTAAIRLLIFDDRVEIINPGSVMGGHWEVIEKEK